jgi:hypothetical protein
MYVIDGIAYAGEQSPAIKVKSVRALDGFRLWIRFTTNEEKLFDFTPLLSFPCYQPLRDKKMFDHVYVDFGTAVWNGGEIDISPEKLYASGTPFKATVSA